MGTVTNLTERGYSLKVYERWSLDSTRVIWIAEIYPTGDEYDLLDSERGDTREEAISKAKARVLELESRPLAPPEWVRL